MIFAAEDAKLKCHVPRFHFVSDNVVLPTLEPHLNPGNVKGQKDEICLDTTDWRGLIPNIAPRHPRRTCLSRESKQQY